MAARADGCSDERHKVTRAASLAACNLDRGAGFQNYTFAVSSVRDTFMGGKQTRPAPVESLVVTH